MSLDSIWKVFGLEVVAENIEGNIAGLTNYNVSQNQQMERTSVDGNPFPTHSRVTSRDEQITLTTLNIDSMIDLAGVGAHCVLMESLQYLRIWLAKWDQCDHQPVGGGVHRYYGVNGAGALKVRAIISVQSLSCNHRGDATGSLAIELLTDPDVNLNLAMVEGVGQSLPVALFDHGNRYTLSPLMVVAGETIANKTGFDLSPNANVERISTDSNIGTDFARVNDHKPVIVIRGIDPTWNVPPEGLLCTHANTRLFLRRRGDTSGVDFAPNNTNNHIKFTVKGRAFKTQLAGGSSNAPSETVLTIYPDYDTVNSMEPIIALTGQAIA